MRQVALQETDGDQVRAAFHFQAGRQVGPIEGAIHIGFDGRGELGILVHDALVADEPLRCQRYRDIAGNVAQEGFRHIDMREPDRRGRHETQFAMRRVNRETVRPEPLRPKRLLPDPLHQAAGQPERDHMARPMVGPCTRVEAFGRIPEGDRHRPEGIDAGHVDQLDAVTLRKLPSRDPIHSPAPCSSANAEPILSSSSGETIVPPAYAIACENPSDAIAPDRKVESTSRKNPMRS
ncbi:hypothetical protein BOSEA31B_11564 [Hyphomicrobiales bacterium]|nr:hypothetical protein BOSEA31B_11564 [Hyphomicrobiales bacterium]